MLVLVIGSYLSSLTSTSILMLRRELRTGEKLVVAATVVARSPCGVYSEFIRQMIQDTSLVLFTAVCLTVGFSFIHFVVQQSPLLAAFEIDF